MKILWCVTGAGHFLKESVEFMEKFSEKNEITVAFSNAGVEVTEMYSLFGKIEKIADEIILEKDQGPSSPAVGKLAKKEFEKILVMPCTANTIAKIANGIADSLVSNFAAQGVKSRTPVIILPTDFRKREETKLPNGKKAIIHLRDVDIENVKKVRKMEGIKIVTKFEEIKI